MTNNAQSHLTFGAELRRLRLAAGMSLTALAGEVHYSKSHLSKVETGRKSPSAELARQCDRVFACGGLLARLVDVRPSETEHLRAGPAGEIWLLEAGATRDGLFQALSPGPMGPKVTALTRLATTTSSVRGDGIAVALPAFNHMFHDVRHLGQTLHSSAVMHVTIGLTGALRRLAHVSSGAERASVLRTAARFAEYTGWMAQESGDEQACLWWTDRAAEFASAAGDSVMPVYATVRRAEVALYRADVVATISFARQAYSSATDPHVRGLALQREAQGLALQGDEQACGRCLDRARLLGEAPPVDDVGVPVGSANMPDPLTFVIAWCMYELGRPRRAYEILNPELARIPQHANRVHARYGARLALALGSAGEVDEACAVTSRVLARMGGIDSATVRSDLRLLLRTLNRWRAYPSVQQVLPDLTAALHLHS